MSIHVLGLLFSGDVFPGDIDFCGGGVASKKGPEISKMTKERTTHGAGVMAL